MGWREKDFELVMQESFLSLVGLPVVRRFVGYSQPETEILGIIYEVRISPRPPDPKRRLAKRWRSGQPFEAEDIEHCLEMGVQGSEGRFYTLYNGIQRYWYAPDGSCVSETMAGIFNAMREV